MLDLVENPKDRFSHIVAHIICPKGHCSGSQGFANTEYMYSLILQICLPLIDDLSNPAMRTRHWKQLVRVTGGALTIDNDTLKRMTLGELLSLGLQRKSTLHVLYRFSALGCHVCHYVTIFEYLQIYSD